MSNQRDQRNLLRYATAGTEFAATFGLFLVGGYLLDRYVVGRLPGFTVLGALCGFLTAVYRLWRKGRTILTDAHARDEDERDDRC